MQKNKFYLVLLIMFIALPLIITAKAFSFDYTSSTLLEDPLKNAMDSKKISMDFKDAQLNDVLKVFSQQSGLNFIAATEVSGKTVNLYLDQVPVQQALERILSANNLTYEIQPGSNIFLVKATQSTETLMTRVYPLKYATVKNSKLNNTFKITPQKSNFEDDSSSSSSTTTTGQDDYGILEVIKSVLTKEQGNLQGGSVVEDPRTNSLVVTDYPSRFPVIEQTIARLDVRVPQILIEVEMLDIAKNTADLLGAKWGNSPVSFYGPQKNELFPYNTDNVWDDVVGPGGTREFEDTPKSGYLAGRMSFAGLQFTLQFLETQTDTKNLARPRIMTLNNETAEIKISTNEAIGVTQSTTSATEGTGSSATEADREETGVFLSVTPQANIVTGEITMAVQPRVVQARLGSTFQINNNNVQFKDPEERGTKSVLRIVDGDTIIIGGLLRTDGQGIHTSVPGLSKIPIVGAAFRHKDRSETERELIVFLTPHIIREDFSGHKGPQREQIVREQDIPQQRWDAVNNGLKQLEK